MVKKLSKYGNSMAIIIDKPILELLNINEHTQLKIKTDGKNIIIEPISPKKTKSSQKKDYEKIIDTYQEALKKLSKN
jgi:antitoxin component of MazEF toxin-antitoxin module